MALEKLNLAIAAIKSGDKETGSRLLATILISEPSNEIAWIWLATSEDDIERKKFCLKKALALNPNNYTYIKALIRLELQSQTYLENMPPPYLPQRTSSENELVFEDHKSEISAPLATPVLPSVKSTYPVHYTYRKHLFNWEEVSKFLFFLLVALSLVACFLAFLFPDLFLNLFE